MPSLSTFIPSTKKHNTITRKYGDVKTSLFSYISFPMVGMILFIITVVALNFEAVKHNFTSGHVALNGLILAVFGVGIAQACYNNLKLWYVARFLADLDSCMEVGNITAAKYQSLQDELEKKATLINVKTTFKLLENLHQYGNLLIRDKDAILIKSKLGARVRTERNNVSFLTGILVMFGLIGTFWGLLETIGAVASALNDIAASSNVEASAEQMDMGGILAAISGPLKGMGLAFSASLFGLSGSLLLGFFMHLASDSQNSSIEDISRWIDDRIPTPDQNVADKGKDIKGIGLKENSDLEAWLATYAYLARRTDQSLLGLFDQLSMLVRQFEHLSVSIQNLDKSQSQTNELLNISNADKALFGQHYEAILENISGLPALVKALGENVTASVNAMSLGSQQSEHLSREIKTALNNIVNVASKMDSAFELMSNIRTDHVQSAKDIASSLRDNHYEMKNNQELSSNALLRTVDILEVMKSEQVRLLSHMNDLFVKLNQSVSEKKETMDGFNKQLEQTCSDYFSKMIDEIQSFRGLEKRDEKSFLFDTDQDEEQTWFQRIFRKKD